MKLNSLLVIGLLTLWAAPAPPSEAVVEPESAALPTPRYIPPPPPRPKPVMPERIPSYFDLDAEVRAEMPDLNLSMIRYHEDPEQRFVILNGIRAGEGLPAGRDLWIHEIRSKEVVMKYIDAYFLLTPR